MMQGELHSIIIAVVAAAILAPLLGRLGSRIFPPRTIHDDDTSPVQHKLRNQIVEYAGVGFLIAGSSVPFYLQGSTDLQPTVTNIILILSFALLFMVVGIVALTAMFGDRNAESFCRYFEQRRGISSSGVRKIATVMVVGSVVALLTVGFLSLRL